MRMRILIYKISISIIRACLLIFICSCEQPKQQEGNLDLNGYILTTPGEIKQELVSMTPTPLFTPTVESITVTNKGETALTLLDISSEGLELDPPFSLSGSSTCTTGTKLAQEESCDLVLSFTPLTH